MTESSSLGNPQIKEKEMFYRTKDATSWHLRRVGVLPVGSARAANVSQSAEYIHAYVHTYPHM